MALYFDIIPFDINVIIFSKVDVDGLRFLYLSLSDEVRATLGSPRLWRPKFEEIMIPGVNICELSGLFDGKDHKFETYFSKYYHIRKCAFTSNDYIEYRSVSIYVHYTNIFNVDIICSYMEPYDIDRLKKHYIEFFHADAGRLLITPSDNGFYLGPLDIHVDSNFVKRLLYYNFQVRVSQYITGIFTFRFLHPGETIDYRK